MKRATAYALVAFFTAMACFGMLARAVDATGCALVATERPARQVAQDGQAALQVPASAVMMDEARQAYVLVVEERAGFLGSELALRRVNVTVVEGGDEEHAALADGSLSPQQDVVARADRNVSDGDKVRRAHG